MIRKQEDLSPTDMYKILTGSVSPRPIAWVSTISSEGVYNLAPFSFFTIASVNPPILCFAPNLKRVSRNGKIIGLPKDTLRNIQDNGEFVVNTVKHEMGAKMVLTGGNFAASVSEFDEAGVMPVRSETVSPPGVAGALVRFECAMLQIISFGHHAGAGNLVLGAIKSVFVDDSVMQEDGELNSKVLDAIARMEADIYCTTRDRFEIREVFEVAAQKAVKEQHLFPFGV